MTSPLDHGTRLGPYEIIAAIGVGGMGEVYRARDTKLGRDVAIKVLPAAFATDPERLARLLREAQVLASLDHPNIAQIHGLEESDTRRALVMELVEGPTLADRIARGPIPPDEALPIAVQIAAALEAAHERGVIHRDLKPSNIKVRTDGTVKVLDFGLAKLQPQEGLAAQDALSSPTITNAATQLGVILGTAAYMAPEQARGAVVDRRADVWSFGCVLYEMLAGRRAFEGRTVSETIASVLAREPEMSRVPESVPAAIVTLLRRCLRKESRQRLQSMGDVRIEIEDTLASSSMGDSPAVAHRRRPRFLAVIAAVATLTAAILGIALLQSSRPKPVAIRAVIPLPDGLFLDGIGPPELALSRDGRTLAFVARGATGVQRLYIRKMDEATAKLVPESDTVEGPFFSPDGRWVAFAVGVSGISGAPPELRKYSLETGLTQTITPLYDYFGGVWTGDDTILYAGSQPEGLWRVSAGGGRPEALVQSFRVGDVDVRRSVAWPDLLPDGRSLLLTQWDTGTLVLVDIASRELTDLGVESQGGRVLPTGHLVYATSNAALMAVAFDLRTRRVTGKPVALLSDIAFGRNGAPVFAFSDEGTFAFATGYLRGSRREPMRLLRVTRAGESTVLPFQPHLLSRSFVLSPDGMTVAASTWEDSSPRLFDLLRGTTLKLLAAGIAEIGSLAWTPDSRRLTIAGRPTGSGLQGIYLQNADGTGQLETLVEPEPIEIHLAGWLPGGRRLAYFVYATTMNTATQIRSVDVGARPRVILQEPGHIFGARVSPDGRWVAYDSSAGGDFQVYVVPLSGEGGRVAVTAGGGRFPVWSRDGRELFFRKDRAVMTIAVEAGPSGIKFGQERRLFEWDALLDYAVGEQGDFYGAEPVPGAALQTSIQFRTGWFTEVARMVAAR